jgi:hypothetical protein
MQARLQAAWAGDITTSNSIKNSSIATFARHYRDHRLAGTNFASSSRLRILAVSGGSGKKFCGRI